MGVHEVARGPRWVRDGCQHGRAVLGVLAEDMHGVLAILQVVQLTDAQDGPQHSGVAAVVRQLIVELRVGNGPEHDDGGVLPSLLGELPPEVLEVGAVAGGVPDLDVLEGPAIVSTFRP